jgi:hypothetical protein
MGRKDKEEYNAYMREYLPKRQKKIREEAIKRFGSICARCGDTNGPFEFDHIDPKQKEIEIGDLWKYGEEKRESELKKCQLLCNPCHREKTCEDNGWLYSVGVHGLPGSHKHCKCDECLSAWVKYQKNRFEILGIAPKARRSKEIVHGTRAGYLKELRLKMGTCDDCKKANTEYTRNLRELKDSLA